MGVGPGCYLVLPVLGPSTVRDTAGSFVNVLGGDAYYNASVMLMIINILLTLIYMAIKSSFTGIDFRAKNLETR